MGNLLKKIDGYKMYAAGVGLILVALAEGMGVDIIPSITTQNYMDHIYTGFLIIAGKSALNKATLKG